MTVRRTIAAAMLGLLVSAPVAFADEILDPASWTENHVLVCEPPYCAPGPPGGSAVAAGPTTTEIRGDYVAFWQNILVADGEAPVCTAYGIDGYYGFRTADATAEWQKDNSTNATEAVINTLHGASGFYIDGVVGPQTWTLAHTKTSFTGVFKDEGFNLYAQFVYVGSNDVFFYTHGATALGPGTIKYDGAVFERFTGTATAWTDTFHPEVNFSRC